MKRPTTWAAGAALAAVIAAGFIPLSMWSTPLREALEEQITRTTGLDAHVSGRVTVAALPFPRVTYENVRIGYPDGAVSIRTDRMTADLRLSNLLSGRVEFTALQLLRPQITVDGADKSLEKTPAIRRVIDAPSASEEARRADRARLGGVKLIDGSVYIRRDEHLAVLIRRVNATVDWPNLGSIATLTGHGEWRGEKVDVDMLVGKPAEVIRGEKSPFTLKLTSRLITISADGSLAGGVRWMVDARVASNSDRFQQFLSLLDAHPPVPGQLSRFALSGQLRALPNNATLSDLRLAIDSNTFDGSLTLLPGENRPKISGTLAARNVDLRASDAGLPVMRRERQWSKEGIAVGRLDLFDADLRLSAGRLSLGRLTLTEAGFVIALKDGVLEITAADAAAYGGSLRARWRFNSRAATPELETSGTFKNINVGSALRAMGNRNLATGGATGEFAIKTRGSSVHAMMQNASGSLRSSFRSPEIIGVDFERALRRTERRPLSIPSELRNGQTNFTAAEINAKIAEGLLILERAVATGPGAQVSIAGEISLANRALRLEIAARQPPPAKAAPDAKEPPSIILDVTGPWDHPALFIDPESLIRRSEAAAPLWRSGNSTLPSAAPLDR